MIIDIHTHAFPDAIAPKALASLVAGAGGIYDPTTDLTAGDLSRLASESGIDYAVLQPVVTKQSQTQRINEWAAEINSRGGNLISFGGIWPHTDDYRRDIDFVVSLGLRGIKLHAEYQDFILDAPEMLKIYDYALSRGLIILHHGGFDPAYPPPFKSDPKRFANVAAAMKGGVIIAGHLGGHAQWDDVERYLCGSGIYLDTSMGSRYYPREQLLRIIRSHGADKILFGTDTPWSSSAEELQFFRQLPISDEERDAILGANAARLLGIEQKRPPRADSEA